MKGVGEVRYRYYFSERRTPRWVCRFSIVMHGQQATLAAALMKLRLGGLPV